ncbi:MAG: hypothetical protein AAF213_03955 [Pseudomonadota bacterium]
MFGNAQGIGHLSCFLTPCRQGQAYTITLAGGAGNDNFNGGNGADMFVFDALTDSGSDIIGGFDVAQDRLQITGMNTTEVLATLRDKGGSAHLYLDGGGIIRLQGIDVADVDAGLFV